MWYFEAGSAGDNGMGRVVKDMLQVEGYYDRCVGNRDLLKKYTSVPVIPYFYKFCDCDFNGKKNVYQFVYNNIDPRCKKGIAIVTVHDIIPVHVRTMDQPHQKLYRQRIEWTLERADYILTVSNYSKKDMVETFGVKEDKVFVIYNAVNPFFKELSLREKENFKRSQGFLGKEKIVLALGNRYPYKNILRIIKAFSKIRSEDQYLVILGDMKGYMQTCKGEIERKGMTDHIILKGKISDEELRGWYNCADVFAFVSLIEGFGLPPLEAMACGTAVITSNTTALDEIVGEAALKVDPTKTSEIAKALKSLLAKDSNLNEWVQKGRQKVEEYSLQRFVKNLNEFYNMVSKKEGMV